MGHVRRLRGRCRLPLATSVDVREGHVQSRPPLREPGERLQRAHAALLGHRERELEDPSYAFARTEPAQVSECGTLTKDDLDLKSRTLLATVFAEDYRRFGYELPDASTSKSALATM